MLAQPLQLGDALWRDAVGRDPRATCRGGLVVCGMGGSAIGGDLAAAALGDRATRPITLVRGYALESVDRGRSAGAVRELLGQHRGDPGLLPDGRRGGRPRVVITTGGKLADLRARKMCR